MKSIRKRAAELIVAEIEFIGFCIVHNNENCIRKVKEELNIDLVVNENGNLIFKK